eukprot:24917_1
MEPTQPPSHTYCPNCTLSPWQKQMLRLATDSKFHDVSFIVGSGTKRVKIGCNRSLLSIHCPVFGAMFDSKMLESSSRCVEIRDIKPVVFAAMLQWMTTDTLNISSICDLSELIALADKYQMNGLLDSCRLFLRQNTITIHVVTDSILSQYHGADLGLNHLKQMSIKLRILLYSSVADIIMAIAKQLNWNTKYIKIWRISNRKNGTIRPNRYLSPNIDAINAQNKDNEKQKEEEEDNAMDLDLCEAPHHSLFDVNAMKCSTCYTGKKPQQPSSRSSHKKSDWSQYCGFHPTKAIFARLCGVEQGADDSKMNGNSNMIQGPLSQSFGMPVYDMSNTSGNRNENENILLFLKYYDVYNEYLSMIGSIVVDKTGSIASICEIIRTIAHWSDEHEILLFEEEDCASNKINAIDLDQNISDTSLVDGDIIVFQEKSKIFNSLQLKNVKRFFEKEFEMNNKRKINKQPNRQHHMLTVDHVDDTFII